MMSITKKIHLVSNLPSGGAYKLYQSNKKFLSNHYEVVEHIESHIQKHRSFLSYMQILLFNDNTWEKMIAKQISKDDICICYHSWLTKSPNILKYLNCKKIYICHEPPREFYDKKHIHLQTLKEKIVNLLRRSIIKNDIDNVQHADIVISNSKFSQKVLKEVYGIQSTVIYPGISNPIKKIDRIIGRKKSIIKLLTVGSINKLKNQQFISDVALAFSDKYKVKLTLVGNGYDNAYLQKIKGNTQYSKNLTVEILQNIDDKRLDKIYRTSDLFLYAPYNEPFGIVVIEALSYGLPIIAYNNSGGYLEIISNKNGKILDNLSAKIWAKQAQLLISDKTRLKRIWRNNVQLAIKYSDIHMNKKLLSIIRSI